MKPIKFLTAILMGLFLVSQPSALAREYSLVLPGMNTIGRGDMVGIISAIKTILKTYEKETGTKITVSTVIDKDGYTRAVRSGKPDFLQIFVINPEDNTQFGYKTFLSVKMYGEEVPKSCLYVSKTSGINTPVQLKNKTILLPKSNLSYFAIRTKLNQKLETFFKKISFKKDDSSAIYALALGQIDAAIVKHAMVRFLEFSNPGPVRKIKPLFCFEDGGWFTLSNHPRVPASEINRLVRFAAQLGKNKNPALLSIKTLMNKLQLQFIPESHSSFMATSKRFQSLIKIGKAKGWATELARLRKLAKSD